MTNQIRNDAASLPTRWQLSWQDASNETSLVSYCFLTSKIPQECGSGNDAMIKVKTAMTPQVILQDGNSSWQ
jgi:hypothetical protein